MNSRGVRDLEHSFKRGCDLSRPHRGQSPEAQSVCFDCWGAE